MNVLQRIKNSPTSLLAISAILLFLAVLAHELFIFFAIAPLFALLDIRIHVRSGYTIVSGLFALAAMALVMRGISPATGTVFYMIIIMVVFVFYQTMQQLTQNRLNKFSLTILLIGLEYLLLKLSFGKLDHLPCRCNSRTNRLDPLEYLHWLSGFFGMDPTGQFTLLSGIILQGTDQLDRRNLRVTRRSIAGAVFFRPYK